MNKFLKSKKNKLLFAELRSSHALHFARAKEYFRKEPSVILAFLFGSYARGWEMTESDVDIGVYLKNEDKEDKIWLNVSRIIQKDVDLVVLNNAPAGLVSNVLKTGVPLTIKDKKLYWELYLKTSSEAEDFLYFLEDFWKIKKEAKSLNKEEKCVKIKK